MALFSGALQLASMQTEQATVTSVARPDGRRARSELTRTSIIEAYIALLRTGDRIPMTPDVARLAKCCVRTLYQHFGTLSQLNEAAAAHIQQAGSISVRAAGSLEERVRTHIKWYAESWERWLPLYSAGGAAGKNGRVTKHLREEYEFKLAMLNFVFAPELSFLPAARRRGLLLMIEAMTSLEAWARLRRQHELSLETATKLFAEVLLKILPGGEGRSSV